MDELEKLSAEQKFFGENDIMILPRLMKIYFEEGNYPLVVYLSDLYQVEFTSLEFYKMLALATLGKISAAEKIYKTRGEDWLNICKQYKIYWKHVILFALYFKQKNSSDWLQDLLNKYYESELVQLYELAGELSAENFVSCPLFKKICESYPSLEKFYQRRADENGLVTFEKIQWQVWDKYNLKLRETPLDENKMQCLYDVDGLKIFSYKPHQVAASMHIITDGATTIILDCGAELVGNVAKNIPVKNILDALNISKVDGVFISHGHLDHYGSLNELPATNFFMTKDTFNIIKITAPNIFLRGVKIKNFYDEVEVGGVKVKFIPNGHIRGSVLFDVNWRGKRIIYTGDYCVESQHTCFGLDLESIMAVPKRVDVLLTESTYGQKIQPLNLREYESVFTAICKAVIEVGKKVLIPSFAVGRAAEVALMLKESARRFGFTILIDGLAAQMTEYYQNSMEQAIIGVDIAVCNSNLELELRERIDNYDVIIASSGTLQEGSISAEYLQKMLEMEKICVMKVGFIHEYENLLLSVFNRRNQNVTYFDIPLSAHADYNSLIAVTEKISPDLAIYVHGNSISKFLG